MRLKLIVSYDGTPFSGWQSQPAGNTIQDLIEQAFLRITDTRVIVCGAGRTDAGVHALAQCAHADVPQNRMKLMEWHRALNANLPLGIRILKVTQMDEGFHARFSSTGKVYQYRIWNAEVMPPLERDRAWHVPGPLNFELLCSNAIFFEGKHDFASFSANRRGAAHRRKTQCDSIRTIHRIQIARRHARQEILLTFEGEGFLYKMVRMLTGALVRVGQGKENATTWIPELLASKTKKSRYVAPAHGLYLMRVFYRKNKNTLGNRPFDGNHSIRDSKRLQWASRQAS